MLANERLFVLRKMKRWSRRHLAELAGVHPSTIQGIETGDNLNPSYETVAKIAAAFNLKPDELFPLDAEKESA